MNSSKYRPPKLANRFLLWFLKKELAEEVLGDLEEKYFATIEQKSHRRAKLNYWYQTFNYLRPFALKNNIITQLNPLFMFRHNFIVSLRSFKRNTSTFLINTFGLALGVTCCLLIGLYIKDEYSYDKQHPNIENLYRVVLDINLNEWSSTITALPPILPKTLVAQIPEVEKATLINPYFDNAGSNLVRKENETENRFEENFVYTDQAFFELFHLPLINGDKNQILNQPNQLVITERIADKYFPDQNPIGETMILNNDPQQFYQITGVTENIPEQTHFNYDFFLSMPSLEDSEKNTNWLFNNYYAYVTLKAGTDPAILQSKFREFSFNNFSPQFKEQQNIDLAAIEKDGQYYRVNLQPVSDIHLNSEGYSPQLSNNGDIKNVRLFSIIALFILLIAIVNFVNLSTARSATRAREVGVRKVLGSFRSQLISQFLWESVLISVLAFIIGSILATWALPFFNDFSGKNLELPFSEIPFLLTLFFSAVLTGLLAGLYPSLYLSAFQPAKVLKGRLGKGGKNSYLRGGLVMFQFAISIALIVGTMVVYKQMNFIQNKKLGFNKEQVLLIQDTYTLDNQLAAFKDAIKNLPETKNATLSSYLPLEGGRRNSISFYSEGKSAAQDQVLLQTWNTDPDYISTLGMQLKEGRGFNIDMPTDSNGVVLNEAAVRSFNLSDPIGKRITSPYREDVYTVIGVVEDFNYESLKGEVRPLGLFLGLSNSVISVKTNTSNMEQLISKSQNIWKSFAPTLPFRYTFLDERFDQMYTVEKRISKLFLIFSALAIFIACLGLLALATFMTEQRVKEIGIRKVLGANVFGIVRMLSADFTKMVLISMLVAFPLSYLAAKNWLEGFAYRIELQPWLFIGAGILALFIAWLTVGYRTVKAALANPVESLKVE